MFFFIWFSFIILMGVSETDDSHYFLFCISMLYVTYLYNQILYIKLTPKIFSVIFFIPSVILWWIIYVYNYLLSFNPISDYIMVYIILTYFYLLVYTYWES